MEIRVSLLLAILLATFDQLFAHALWIETKSTGKVGQVHEVKLFYGEYSGNQKEEISNWYSDVRECKLWVVAPDRQTIQLKTTLATNYALADFTPPKNGIYTLMVSHEAKELGGTTRYTFFATSTVFVGTVSKNEVLFLNRGELKVFMENSLAKVNTLVKLKASQADTLKARTRISVFSPTGWSREVVTGVDGIAEFVPLWPGRYVVEVEDYQKIPGEHNGKKYEAIWKGATYSFEVFE